MTGPSGLRIFSQAIVVPPLLPRPLKYKVPFYRLAHHHVPVLWSLYRPLLRLAKTVSSNTSVSAEDHVQEVRERWRDARNRSCTSPRKTVALLKQEEDWLELYRDVLQDGGKRNLNLERFAEFQVLENDLKARGEAERLASLVQEEYDLARDAMPVRQPILTPNLIHPTLINPPLPRLKPQPLHLTMPIVKRRRTRDKRILQEKAWQEMFWHTRLEVGFEADLGLPSDYTLVDNVRGMLGHFAERNQRDYARLKTKFPVEMLQAADEARRRRPKVLTEKKRQRTTAERMKRLLEVQEEAADAALDTQQG